MGAYIIARTLPSGEVRRQGPVATKREAGKFVFYSLLDNGLADKRDATDLAHALEMLPIGSRMEHAGYSFQILPACEHGPK